MSALAENQFHYIYLIRDVENKIRWVGMTVNVERRLLEHKKKNPWMQAVSLEVVDTANNLEEATFARRCARDMYKINCK